MLISILPVHSPAFFSKTPTRVCPVLALAIIGSSVSLQNKMVALLGADSSVECLWNINRLQNVLVFLGLRSDIVLGMNDLEID